MAALRSELEELRDRMDTLATSELVVRGEGTGVEWRSAVQKVEVRLRGVEERVEINVFDDIHENGNKGKTACMWRK